MPCRHPRGRRKSTAAAFFGVCMFLGWIGFGTAQGTNTVNVLMKPLFEDSTADELNQFTNLTTQFTQQTGIKVFIDMQPTQTAEAHDYLKFVRPVVTQSSTKYDIVALEVSWLEEWPDYLFNLFSLEQDIDALGSGLARQLSERITAEYEEIINGDAVQGDLVALPMWTDYGLTYGRSDLLAKYNITTPTKLDDMYSACQKIIAGEGPTRRSLQCFVAGFQDLDIVDVFSEWVYTDSATHLIRFRQQPNFNSASNKELLIKVTQWTRGDPNFITPRAMQFDSGTALKTWLAGDAIFYRGKASELLRISQAWQGRATTYVVMSGNNPSAANPLASVQGGYHLAMSRAGGYQNDTAVAQVLLFLTGPEVQKARATRFGALPTLKSLYNDSTVCAAVQCPTLTNLVSFQLPSSAAAPLWVESALALSTYFTGILNGTYDPGTGLAQAHAAVVNIYNNPPSRGTSNSGLGTTGTILLSVLIPLAVVFALFGGVYAWKRRRIRKAKLTAHVKTLEAGASPSASPNGGPPPMTEIPEFTNATATPNPALINVSVRAARRPESTTDSNRVVHPEASADRPSIDELRPDTKGKLPALTGRSRTPSTDTHSLTPTGGPHQNFTVIHPYKPVMADELELKPGDNVTLRLAYDDGYAFGQTSDSRAGVFPLACLLPVGMQVGLPSRLESGAMNAGIMQHAPEKVDSLEWLLLSGRITEGTYLALRREQEEEMRTLRQITALRERLSGNVEGEERKRLQRRLDELELGI